MSHAVGEGNGDVHEPGGVGGWVWGQEAGDGAEFGACAPCGGGGAENLLQINPEKCK